MRGDGAGSGIPYRRITPSFRPQQAEKTAPCQTGCPNCGDIRGWIGTVAEKADLLEAVLALDGVAADHAFYLKEMAEQSRFLMSEAEETLASELSLSGAAAWEKLQGVVTSQIKVPFEREGKTQELPITMIINH